MASFVQRAEHGLDNVLRTGARETVSAKITLAFRAAYIYVLNPSGWRISDGKGTRAIIKIGLGDLSY